MTRAKHAHGFGFESNGPRDGRTPTLALTSFESFQVLPHKCIYSKFEMHVTKLAHNMVNQNGKI